MKFLKFPWRLVLRVVYAVVTTCVELFKNEKKKN